MSRRQTPTKRLERRPEREARQPGSAAPRPQRQRPGHTPAKTGGRFSNISWLPILAGIGVLAIIAMLFYLITQSDNTDKGPSKVMEAQLNTDPKLPGTYVPPHPGADGVFGTSDDREHYANGRVVPICTTDQVAKNEISNPVCYTTNPPTSGPHASSPMPFRVLENPAPKENLIHNMEHGGVVIWYNTSDQSIIDQLTSIANDALDRRRLVVMSKYTEMEPETIALTGWTRIDKFPVGEFQKKRAEDFISEHQRRFNPEGF